MTGLSLSARSVKQILTRAGVDWRALTITEQRVTARDAWNGGPWETYMEVRLEGPRDAHDRAYLALSCDKGLSVAPYPEYSLWSRSRRAK